MSILRRVLAFLVLFAALQLSWQMLRGTSVEYAVIHYGTVRPAAAIIDLMSPQLFAKGVEFSVRAVGGGVNVLNGCEGLDAVFLLVAAFVAVAIPLRDKVRGLLLGIPFVFLVNQLRLVILFYAYRRDAALFDLLHSAVAPIAIVLAITLYLHAWLARGRSRVATSA